MFEIKAKDMRGRVGVLKTKHGAIKHRVLDKMVNSATWVFHDSRTDILRTPRQIFWQKSSSATFPFANGNLPKPFVNNVSRTSIIKIYLIFS